LLHILYQWLSTDTAQQKFVYQFRRPGVFPYHCHFHGGPGGKGMAGGVTVVERTP
jgi:plastocyanin